MLGSWICRRSGPGPLLLRDLAAAGVDGDEVRRMHRRGELACIAPGVYVDPADPRLRRPEDRHQMQVAAAVPRIASDAVVSHQSAAVLHGLPAWNLPLARVHATRPRRSGALRTGTAARPHGRRSSPTRSPTVDGVAVTAVARTAVDVARTVGFEEAVAVLDAALHRHLVTVGRARRRAGPDGGLARRSQGATGGRVRRPAAR